MKSVFGEKLLLYLPAGVDFSGKDKITPHFLLNFE
jgi:hypothetical protein